MTELMQSKKNMPHVTDLVFILKRKFMSKLLYSRLMQTKNTVTLINISNAVFRDRYS